MTDGGFLTLAAEAFFVVVLMVAWHSGALTMMIEWLMSLKAG